MTRPERAAGALATLAAACCALLVACGSGGGSASSSSSSSGSVSTTAAGRSIPGQIDQNPQGFFSRDLVRPVVNAWRTSNGDRFTEVDAGALASDRSVGVLALYRGANGGSAQGATLKKVLGSGPLRIVGAPTGVAVEMRAQTGGRIRFVGANGVRGTLSLRDRTIALRPPRGDRRAG